MNSTLLEYNSHKAAVMNYIKFKIMKDEKGQMSQKGIYISPSYFLEKDSDFKYVEKLIKE